MILSFAKKKDLVPQFPSHVQLIKMKIKYLDLYHGHITIQQHKYRLKQASSNEVQHHFN